MIAILTDKPSVGKEIGRIIGATKVRNGYVGGNGYMVTWTFGNMLSLAMPKRLRNPKAVNTDWLHTLSSDCSANLWQKSIFH
ncbi:MAG TPA: hypothetical protein OIM59_06375 [Bacteroides mediterraneensis]|uniref:hypothetical protein n=1 Tax=Bacteroides mediterraneensis TaxID=1841856 RepID=UPI002632B1D4|nr:hypothetical protein [Bacteroides mediterraneensis]HJH64249.1 hypothetical protein [Bacteroides mediterraneensis]